MRGDGRIFLRGNVYWCGYYVRGKEYRESTGQTDEKKARNFLRRRLAEIAADHLGFDAFTTPRATKIAIHELVEALKSDFELRGKGSSQNVSVIKRVDSDFGMYRAIELTADKIDRYIEARLADGDKPATINRTTQILGQSYALAVKRKILSESKVPYIRHLPEQGNERKGFFSHREIRAVIDYLPAHIQDFVLFGYLTGWRKKEIASLTWNDVEGDTVCLRGVNAKNGESRSVPIDGELVDVLARRRQARLVDGVLVRYVFHRRGEPIGEFRRSWKTAAIAAGVGKMVCDKCAESECKHNRKYVGRIFHDLRRTAVRDMVRAGTPETVAMSISGHKTRSIFDRYNITSSDDQRDALRKTAEYRRDQQQKVVPIGN